MGKEIIKGLFSIKDNKALNVISDNVMQVAKKFGLEEEVHKISDLLNNPDTVVNGVASTIKEAIVDPETIIVKFEESKKNLVREVFLVLQKGVILGFMRVI